MFFEENKKLLEEFSCLSKAAGSRADYVQGGGGNTSVKLANGLMAIKASGFCLADIDPHHAYAVLDYADLRAFYHGTEMSDFEDPEKAGSDRAKAAVREIDGLANLRPSVEAGFHSLLKTFVLHSHSVYANLAACSNSCGEIAEAAFAGAYYTWTMVPYVDPGAKLTYVIRDALRQSEEKTGKTPSVILMQNHGIIVHDDDPDHCLAIHADANRRIARKFGLAGNAFPEIRIKKMAGGIIAADTPYLRDRLRNCEYTQSMFMEHPLYPDQMVFLLDSFFLNKLGLDDGQCVADTQTGEMLLFMDAKKAQTITETLTAVLFIMENIETAGYTVSSMGEAAKHFIANWESEKYRKSLAAAK